MKLFLHISLWFEQKCIPLHPVLNNVSVNMKQFMMTLGTTLYWTRIQ